MAAPPLTMMFSVSVGHHVIDIPTNFFKRDSPSEFPVFFSFFLSTDSQVQIYQGLKLVVDAASLVRKFLNMNVQINYHNM